MTKTEIINVVKNIRNYMVSGNPICDKDTVYEALSTAIDALERTDTHECVDPTHACDLISRNAALALVVKAIHGTDSEEIKDYLFGGLRKELWALPSAQPERKKGKWIQNDNSTYSCSLCHSWITEEQYYYSQFCLYCGADMRGDTQ